MADTPEYRAVSTSTSWWKELKMIYFFIQSMFVVVVFSFFPVVPHEYCYGSALSI